MRHTTIAEQGAAFDREIIVAEQDRQQRPNHDAPVRPSISDSGSQVSDDEEDVVVTDIVVNELHSAEGHPHRRAMCWVWPKA